VSGPFGKLRQIGMKAEQFTTFGQEGFRAVGEKAEMANSHKPMRKDMKQESPDKFLDWELSDLNGSALCRVDRGVAYNTGPVW